MTRTVTARYLRHGLCQCKPEKVETMLLKYLKHYVNNNKNAASDFPVSNEHPSNDRNRNVSFRIAR